MRVFQKSDGYFYPVPQDTRPGEDPIADANLRMELHAEDDGVLRLRVPAPQYHPLYYWDGRQMVGADVPVASPHGGAAVLCGGHPSIRGQRLPSMMPVMALNNTAGLVDAEWMVALDQPGEYDQNLLSASRRDHTVFARMNYADAMVDGCAWKHQPNVLFISDIGKEEGDWLQGPLVWFKNGFCLAIQLLYRMGFRRIILAGCAFKDAGQYAYGKRPDLKAQNEKLYNQQLEWLKRNLPYFAGKGLHIQNATPNTAATFLPQAPEATQ